MEYVVRFIGLHGSDEQVRTVAQGLHRAYRYEDEHCRYRYAIFAREPVEHWKQRGVLYFTFEEAVRFINEVRGQSWCDLGPGVKSVHSQWDPLIKRVFEIANDPGLKEQQRFHQVMRELEGSEARHPPTFI